ncbi:NRDE-2, necessary for RNA interference-domain-containing protein, partial [Mycena amicta]
QQIHLPEKRRKRDKKRDDKSTQSQTAVENAPSRPVDHFSDRRGDPLNIQYGRLNTRDVPRYYSGRLVLGLPHFQAVRTGNGIEVGLRGRRQMPSLTDASSRTLLLRNPTRSLVHTTNTTKYEEHDGFLRLPSRSVKQTYREIENTANSDSDSALSDADESTEEEPLTSHEMRVVNERVAADPSVANWLSLLSHTLSTTNTTTSRNSTRARSEISISVLSRALTATNNSPVLRLKYLEAGEEVWPENKLRSEWEEALKDQKDLNVWISWIDWRWRTCKNGISSLVTDAERALSALHEDEIARIMIFWRLGCYGERATAMFQAQAELAFHLPPNLVGRSFSQLLDALEEYWESETGRVGELGSTGWAAWLASDRIPTFPPARHQSSPPDDLDPYRKFAFSENMADRTFFIPRRSTDAETETDPYTLILFSDIKSILFPLTSANAKNIFRYTWLSLLGLNIPGFPSAYLSPSVTHSYERWCLECLVRPAFLDQLFPSNESRSRITTDAFAGTTIGRQRDYVSGLSCPVASWAWNVVHPLAVPSAEGRSKGLWSTADLTDIDVDFVANVFQQLRMTGDSTWDSFALTWACASSIKSAIKLSRGFLSTASESLAHWAAHGRLEQLRGRPADARKVYETVLLSGSRAEEAAQLWYDWAELEWLEGGVDTCRKVILRSVGVEGSGGVALLRAKRILDDAINTTEGPTLEAWIKLRAMLELLAGGVFEGRRGSDGESLKVGELLMLYRYSMVLRNPMRPGLLRERVETAIQLYPDNSVLLGLFLESQRGQGMWGKVRSRLGGEDKSVLQRIQDVWIAGWEKGRWEAEMERTRSGLAAAVDNERTRHSLIIWRQVLEFEIRVGDLRRAKQLFFRAIGECPLAKELYLLAFGPLRSVFSGHELSGIADTMVERQVRLRQGLEEFVDGWEEDKATDDGLDDGDEMLVDAEAYRARLPF